MNSSTKVKRYYDDWHNYENDLLQRGYYLPFQLVQKTMPYLDNCRSILDVGCGSGLVGKALRWEGWAGRLVGIDIASRRIAEARTKKVYNLLRTANAYHLPGRNESFDAVLSNAVLGLAGPRAWQEMVRLAKLDGIISVTVGDSTTNQELHGRCLSTIDRIIHDSEIDVIIHRDLGTGFDTVVSDEHYQLFITRKRRQLKTRR